MALYWGVTPKRLGRLDSTDEMIEWAAREALAQGLVSEGDGIAIVAGTAPHQAASTNLLKLHIVGTGAAGVPPG